MSSGPACREKAHRPWWWVSAYRHNVSAFSGYQYTTSDWSEVRCAAPRELGPCADQYGSTRFVWRTKAAYVDGLPRRAPLQPRKDDE